MIFGYLLWTPRMCVDNSSLLPLATTGTRCWSRRTEGTGDGTGARGRRVLETNRGVLLP